MGSMQSLTVLRAILVLPVWLLLSPAYGNPHQVPTGHFARGIYHASWTERDGAPHGVRALAQTTDGYLWLGTTAGLFRFDGLRFTTYVPPADGPQFKSLDIYSLTGDAKGGLWIGFRVGGVAYLRGGRLTVYNERSGLPPVHVDQILARSDGQVWTVTGGRLLSLKAVRWEDADLGLPPGKHEIKRVFFDRSGNLWVNDGDRIYLRRSGQAAFSDTGSQVRHVTQFTQAPDGSVWIADGWTSLRPISGSSESQWQTRLRGAASFLFDARGALWIANDYYGVDHAGPEVWQHGLAGAATDHLDAAAGLTSSECGGILEDREGNIWVGTLLGLDRFGPARFHPFSSATLRSFPGVAAGANGVVWIGDWGNPLQRVQGDSTQEVGPKLGWGPVHVDRNGIFWGYDYWFSKLWKVVDQKLEQIPLLPSLERAVVQSIADDGQGGIYVAFEGSTGIWHWHNGHWTRLTASGVPSETPFCLFFDSTGRLWAGYVDGRIAVLERGGGRVFRVGRGDFGSVMTIYQDRERIWAGGTNGLAIYTGNGFRVLQAVEGLDARGISGVVSSRTRDLWLNGARAVLRVPAGEIEKALATPAYRFHAETFDSRDGVAGGAAQLRPTPTAIADSTGRLWFATDSNLVSIDPSDFDDQEPPPQITIESLRSDRKEERPWGTDRLVVRPRNLEIDYVGISLSASHRVVYRYMLEGEDSDWQEVGARRQAFYSSLRPGTFRFRVAASVANGRWSEYTLPTEIVVLPAFYQTMWCKVISAAVLLVVLALGHRLRMQYVTSRMRDRLEERAAERVRIARDLHDTLLQGLQGLMLRFHFATEQIPEEEPSRLLMKQTLEVADRIVAEGRDSVRTLRAELSGRELSIALAEAGAELNWEQRVDFSVITEGSSEIVGSKVASELYFIGREAIANAFRHSRASQIQVELISDNKEIRLRCRDDGRGIDPEFLKNEIGKHHWGFVGMRERSQKIGARFECWSAPGHGTEITVTVSVELYAAVK